VLLLLQRTRSVALHICASQIRCLRGFGLDYLASTYSAKEGAIMMLPCSRIRMLRSHLPPHKDIHTLGPFEPLEFSFSFGVLQIDCLRGFRFNSGFNILCLVLTLLFRERWGDYDAPLRSHRGRVGLSRMYCIIHSMYSTIMH
jgi:hypothetical protein